MSTRDDVPCPAKIDSMEVDDIIKRLAGSPNFTAGVAEIFSVTMEAGIAIGKGAGGNGELAGKVAVVAASELGNERVSNRGPRHRRGGELGSAAACLLTARRFHAS